MAEDIAPRLAEFITGTRLEDIPAETITFVKGLIAKTAAGMLVGSRMPAGRKLTKALEQRKAVPELKIIGCGLETSLREAVFTHAMFAHASELEDDRFGGGVSWDITVLPITFSLAAKNHLSGKEFLEASITGLEVHCRTCLFPSEHRGILVVPGAIGPAAAAAKALKLSTEETAFAMGMGLASSAVTGPNHGTDGHYFESAIQSLQGLMGAEMAALGLVSNPPHRRVPHRPAWRGQGEHGGNHGRPGQTLAPARNLDKEVSLLLRDTPPD
ncbi:MAG: MmgE/PrpD family protein [Chloroflexota bacterium]